MKTLRPTLFALLALLAAPIACEGDDGGASDPDTSAADVVDPDAGLDAAGLDAAEPDAADASAPDAADVPALTPLPLDEPLLPGEVRAGVVDDAAALLTGPKAEGRVGDVKMYNSRGAFVIEGVRRASGYRYQGGHPVDVAPLDAAGQALPDLYGEAFFAWDLDILYPDGIEVVDDGRDGGAAHVRVTGQTGPFAFADDTIGPLLPRPAPDLGMVYDYTLAPDQPWLRLDITLQNPWPDDVELDLPLVLAHFGDGAFVWAPGLGYDAEGSPGIVPYYAAVGRDASYALIMERDDLTTLYTYTGVSIMQQGPVLVPAEGDATLTAWFAVTDGGAEGLREIAAQLRGDSGATGEIAGAVVLPDTVAPDSAFVAVRRNGEVVTSGPVAADGTFRCRVEPGAYAVEVWADGHAGAVPVGADVLPDSETPVLVEVPEAARVTLTVSEAVTGEPVPARVTFIRQGDTLAAWPPDDVRPVKKSWSGGTSAVALVTGADETVLVPAGTYRVVAGRGPTHTVDERVITVAPGENPPLDLVIADVIDTTGWISSDFHVHALWSPDSYVPYDIRARQAATEDLDLPVISEHVYVSNFAGVPDAVGVGDHVIGMPAQEVTTFGFGHFNAFPLVWDPSKPNMGAVFPFDTNPAKLFQDIRDQGPGDEIIQVNHPRGLGAGSYFSHVGLDAAANTVGQPDRWSTEWDTVEVFNGGCGGADNSVTVADWIGLTNHGHRKVLASGSDTHSERQPPGTPRNWLAVDFATVDEDPENLVPVVRARRLVVSCGPFVTFDAVDAAGAVTATLGGLAPVEADGRVRFRATVQAPAWMTVGTVQLWENGVVVDAVDVSAAADPVRRFDGTLEAFPAADAWYALEVVGSGSMAPVILGSPPYALTNPIEVDADGDGLWSPPGGGEALPPQ